MGLKKRFGQGGAAFDAVGSSSAMAFLNSQLELPDMEIVKPLTSMTHPRDITVESGGGYLDFLSAYSSDYATTGSNQYGLQGTSNTDIAEIQVSVSKGLWHCYNWASGFTITHLDLEKLATAKRYGQAAPFSLQELLEDGVTLTWNKACEVLTYLGWMNQPGIVNNPAVTSSLAPLNAGGTSRLWANKSPVEIQADINFMLLQTVSAGAFSLDSMADTILIPWSRYSILQQPMTIGGYSSILRFVLENNIAKDNGIDLKIFPLANDWIEAQGAGSTARGVAYRNNKKTVKLRTPQPATKIMTIPTADKGGAYMTIYNGCFGQVQFYRTQPFYYLDSI